MNIFLNIYIKSFTNKRKFTKPFLREERDAFKKEL